MDEQELLREMEAQNRWWAETFRQEAGLVERTAFPELRRGLKAREVTGIIGLRRVGKTTLMKQLIAGLLDEGTDPRHILYFSFDGLAQQERAATQVVDAYCAHILETTPEKLSHKVYLFLDEIQKVAQWGEEIKLLYDKGYPIKFFVSGSSSMNILRGSGESLVGRIRLHTIFPFTFREFLAAEGTAVPQADMEFPLPRRSKELAVLCTKYLSYGGFPELYSLPVIERRNKLKTYLDLTFYRDIVNLFETKRPDVLDGLFYIFLKHTGEIVNYNSLAVSLKTAFETLKTYIEYLSLSFLISQSRVYSASRHIPEKNAKIYVADHAFSLLSPPDEGMKVETVVYNHCKIMVERGAFDNLSHWRDRAHEVDIILSSPRRVLPIEVKFRDDPTKISGLLRFMEKNNISKGIVVTKDLYEIRKFGRKTIRFIPLWLFLLAA